MTRISNKTFKGNLNLSGLKAYQKMYEDFGSGDSLNRLAKKVQYMAREAIKDRFFSTKAGTKNYHSAYRSKGMRQHLEYRLFDMPLAEPVRTSNSSFEFVMVPDPSTIDRDVPHLKWQEEGTRSMVDKQPYLITGNGLAPISKVKAQALMRRRSGKAPIKVLDVPHPALRARNFIRAGSLFLNRYWPSIVKQWYQDEQARYSN